MDGSRFDRLAKTLTAVGSRRQALGGLLVASLALLGGPAPEEATAKPRHTDRKDRKKDRTKERRQDRRGCLSPKRDLQEAIKAAKPGATLVLCPGTWRVKKAVNISKDLTLLGAGADQSVLEKGGIFGMLEIAAGASVTVQDLTITRGDGAMFNEGTLTLVDVIVTGNNDGISNHGTLTLVRSSVTGNTTRGGGGGISNTESGTVTLQDNSHVTGNTARVGGGIYNIGVVTLKAGCSVSGNIAEDHAGGIANEGLNVWDSSGFHEYRGTVTLEAGSGVTGNRARLAGGGIDNWGSVILQAGSSVSGNSGLDGGGIHVDAGRVSVADSTIVVNNSPNNCAGTVLDTCIGCAANHTECGGECVDTRTNSKNCGGCSQVCDPAAYCVKGVCLA
jgi:hypothetical protein